MYCTSSAVQPSGILLINGWSEIKSGNQTVEFFPQFHVYDTSIIINTNLLLNK